MTCTYITPNPTMFTEIQNTSFKIGSPAFPPPTTDCELHQHHDDSPPTMLQFMPRLTT